MSVPETSVNKNYCPMFAEDDIGFARNLGNMGTEAEAEFAKHPPHDDFGRGVLARYSRHDGASFLRSENIHYERSLRSCSTHPATADARRGGTAFPICFAISILEPMNLKSSGKVWNRASSRCV